MVTFDKCELVRAGNLTGQAKRRAAVMVTKLPRHRRSSKAILRAEKRWPEVDSLIRFSLSTYGMTPHHADNRRSLHKPQVSAPLRSSAKSSSTLFSQIFHVRSGACILLPARACASLQLATFDPKMIFKTMPYNCLAGANWRGCDRKRAASETNSD